MSDKCPECELTIYSQSAMGPHYVDHEYACEELQNLRSLAADLRRVIDSKDGEIQQLLKAIRSFRLTQPDHD